MQGNSTSPDPVGQGPLDPEMQALCDRYLSEAANLPDPISSCPLHPHALLAERTMHGRLGCVGCLTDPFSLDASEIEETDGGRACPP